MRLKAFARGIGYEIQSLHLNLFPVSSAPLTERALLRRAWEAFFPNSERFGPALKALAVRCRMASRLFHAENLSFVIWHQILSCHPACPTLLGLYGVSFVLLVRTMEQRGCRERLCLSHSNPALQSQAQLSCSHVKEDCWILIFLNNRMGLPGDVPRAFIATSASLRGETIERRQQLTPCQQQPEFSVLIRLSVANC